MFGNIGMTEICIVLAIALILFGPRQLPKLGRSLGEGIREFRGVGRELRKAVDEDDERTTPD